MSPSSKVRVKVQKRSGFDKSHFNLLTAQVGSLVPIMVDEVIGNTKVYLRVNLQATMPPLVSDTYMKTDVRVEAFFCPHRLLYGGFESWYTQRNDKVIGPYGTMQDTKVFFPALGLDTGDEEFPFDKFGAGSLSDYLGMKDTIPRREIDMYLNPMPYLCYHLIWQEYYRAPLIEKPCFARPSADLLSYGGGQVQRGFSLMALPYISLDEVNYHSNVINVVYAGLADDTSLWDLRQRNFGLDYFTNAFPTPSLGGDQEVRIADSKFTISALRAANSLQQFQEKNQIAGTRYSDTVLARTGKSPSDGVVQRPVLLGAAKYNAYNKSIDSYGGQNPYGADFNPFTNGTVTTFGKMVVSGSDLLIDGFECNEPGYIMVIASLVPTVTYSSGTSRILTRYRDMHGSIADMANPMLQNVGNEPIYRYELTGGVGTSDSEVPIFGYTDRFASWCTMNDEIHGLFRTGYSLESFVSQRFFAHGQNPTINSNFLKIPTNYLNGVTMLGDDMADFGYWMQIGFDYKVSQPLAEYSIPSLQDPAYEHGQTITLHRGGFRF